MADPTSLPGVDEHQPIPTKNTRAAIQDLVLEDLGYCVNFAPDVRDGMAADIQARKQVGLERYGTLLQAFNGRDALLDAYQEALDLCVYLRQVLEEQVRGEHRGVFYAAYSDALQVALKLRREMSKRG